MLTITLLGDIPLLQVHKFIVSNYYKDIIICRSGFVYVLAEGREAYLIVR